MIICRTPYRISFFGGGTDYPGWYRSHGGAVLATTIDKYCYLTCRHLPPFFEHRLRVVYRKIETCRHASEIEHPVVREALRFLKFEGDVELHHVGDLPARSGMGSSSSFTVALLHALHALRGEMVTKTQLAREALYLEQEVLQETVGSQDQVMAAHGGLRHVKFHPSGEIAIDPLILPRARVRELESHLMLFYTGIARTAADVAKSYAVDLEARRRQLRIMKELVDESIDILCSGSEIGGFGELMHEGWLAKRSLSSQVSNSEVDSLYERARAAGALGGKLTGAGGGGFLLLFVEPDRRTAVRDALGDRLHVPFRFETEGSQIIFYEAPVHAGAEPARRPGPHFRHDGFARLQHRQPRGRPHRGPQPLPHDLRRLRRRARHGTGAQATRQGRHRRQDSRHFDPELRRTRSDARQRRRSACASQRDQPPRRDVPQSRRDRLRDLDDRYRRPQRQNRRLHRPDVVVWDHRDGPDGPDRLVVRRKSVGGGE